MKDPALNGLLEASQRLLTTRSFDVATADTVVNWMRDRMGRLLPPTGSLTQAVRQLLLANGVPPDRVDSQVDVMLPFEIRRGGKFNLNRLFGQGLDDDGNLAVDDESWLDRNGNGQVDAGRNRTVLGQRHTLGQQPVGRLSTAERRSHLSTMAAQWLEPGEPLPPVFGQAPLRQAFARHLYCLIMFLKQPGAEIDFDGIDHNRDGKSSTSGTTRRRKRHAGLPNGA